MSSITGDQRTGEASEGAGAEESSVDVPRSLSQKTIDGPPSGTPISGSDQLIAQRQNLAGTFNPGPSALTSERKESSGTTAESLLHAVSAAAKAARVSEGERSRKVNAEQDAIAVPIVFDVFITAPIAPETKAVSQNPGGAGSGEAQDAPLPNIESRLQRIPRLQADEQNAIVSGSEQPGLSPMPDLVFKASAEEISKNILGGAEIARSTDKITDKITGKLTEPITGEIQGEGSHSDFPLRVAAESSTTDTAFTVNTALERSGIDRIGSSGKLQRKSDSGSERITGHLRVAVKDDETAFARVPVEMNTAGTPHLLDQQTSRSSAGDQNPFASLDAEVGNQIVSWRLASPRHAEAGYVDPALGWVTVRADLHAGNVHAAVTGSSADAAAVLGAELAGLSSHLADRDIPIQSISIANGQTGGSGDAMQHGGQQHGSDGQRTSEPVAVFSETHMDRSLPLLEELIGSVIPGSISTGNGNRISVRV